MATNSRKQVVFDLDTAALKKYYPSNSWNNAYDVVKRHMQNNGFKWLQGSVYVSEKPMSPVKVNRILGRLVANNPWLNVCMRDCRQTNIEREYDVNYLFDKNVKVPTREELKAQAQGATTREAKEGSLSGYMAEINKMRQSNFKEPKGPKIQWDNRGKSER